MEMINVSASREQWSVLLQLLNIGTKSGAYDLASVQAIAFWAQMIEDSAKPKTDVMGEVKPESE